jgi:hypothetical protein
VNLARPDHRVRGYRLVLNEHIPLTCQQTDVSSEHKVNPARRNNHPTASRAAAVKYVQGTHSGSYLNNRRIIQLRPVRDANRLIRNRYSTTQIDVRTAIIRIKNPTHVASRVRHSLPDTHEYRSDHHIPINTERITHPPTVQNNPTCNEIRPLRTGTTAESPLAEIRWQICLVSHF